MIYARKNRRSLHKRRRAYSYPRAFGAYKIRPKKGFSAKFDTNGTNPEMLKNLIDEDLINYAAMDIKNSPYAITKPAVQRFCRKLKKAFVF